METTITDNNTGLKVNVNVTIDMKTAAILGLVIFVSILGALIISRVVVK